MVNYKFLNPQSFTRLLTRTDRMEATDTFFGIAIPTEIIVPTKTGTQTGKAGTIFLSGAKLYVVPTDGGTAELVTSA